MNAVDDLIPVDQAFGFQGPAVFYLVSEFVTKEDGKIGISIGRTSPLVFWLDGRELARAEFETYLTPENINLDPVNYKAAFRPGERMDAHVVGWEFLDGTE